MPATWLVWPTSWQHTGLLTVGGAGGVGSKQLGQQGLHALLVVAQRHVSAVQLQGVQLQQPGALVQAGGALGGALGQRGAGH